MHLLAVNADHRLAEALGHLGDDLGIVVVGDCLDDGAGALGGRRRGVRSKYRA